MIKIYFSILYILLSCSIFAQQVFETNFDGHILGVAYTRNLWQNDGFSTGNWDNGLATRTLLDNTNSYSGTQSLRVTYPAGGYGPSETGCQVTLEFEPQQEMYMSYMLKFSDNFSWGTTSEGGKLPGLAGGGRCSGCAVCDGANGFTARLMWRESGRAVLYLYHIEKQNNCGDDLQLVYPWGNNVVFERGKWYHVMQRVRVNSNAENYDGEVQIWINGHSVLDISGYRFTTNNDMVDNLYFSTFHGGSTVDWSPTETCYSWFDDVKISDNAEDVEYKNCSKPNLGSNRSLCGVSSILLESNIISDEAQYLWLRENEIVGTTHSLEVEEEGSYIMIYDSLGCIYRDTIIVFSNLHPQLGNDREICKSSFEELNANIWGDSITYTWTKNGDLIMGANQNFYNVFEAGTYRVNVSAPNCSDAYSELTVTSNLLPITTSVDEDSQIATIQVNEQGNYYWYDEYENLIFEGNPYEEELNSQERFVFVQDASGYTGLVGKKNSGTTYTDNRFDRRMRFETYTTLTIDSITIYAVEDQDVTIRILDSEQTEILYSITHNSLPAGENRIFIGAELPSGLLYMDAQGSTGRLIYSNQNDTDIQFPYVIDGIISLQGSNLAWIDNYPYYLFFYNWRVTVGNACAKAPVLLKSNITPTIVTQTIELEQGWNLISISVGCTDLACNVSTVFDNENVEIVKNDDGFWKPNQPIFLNSINSIETGKGYLVYMNASDTIRISGSLHIQNYDTISFSDGWQLIGYPCTNESLNPILISDYFDVSNCEIIKNFEGFWEPNGTTNSIQNFELGKGYFMKAK